MQTPSPLAPRSSQPTLCSLPSSAHPCPPPSPPNKSELSHYSPCGGLKGCDRPRQCIPRRQHPGKCGFAAGRHPDTLRQPRTTRSRSPPPPTICLSLSPATSFPPYPAGGVCGKETPWGRCVLEGSKEQSSLEKVAGGNVPARGGWRSRRGGGRVLTGCEPWQSSSRRGCLSLGFPSLSLGSL